MSVMDSIDWRFVTQLIVTLLLGALTVHMQHKNNALVEAGLLATAKKKPVPKVGFFRQYWPVMLMFLLVAVNWIPHFLSPQAPTNYFQYWGMSPPGATSNDPQTGGLIATDGGLFKKYHDDFKLAGVLFFALPGSDAYDDHGLQKSKPYEIRSETINIYIPWDATYRQQVAKGMRHTSYVLLLVPNNVDMSSFDTLHQAQALGVKVVGINGGPP
jgi:hypothetical protein